MDQAERRVANARPPILPPKKQPNPPWDMILQALNTVGGELGGQTITSGHPGILQNRTPTFRDTADTLSNYTKPYIYLAEDVKSPLARFLGGEVEKIPQDTKMRLAAQMYGLQAMNQDNPDGQETMAAEEAMMSILPVSGMAAKTQRTPMQEALAKALTEGTSTPVNFGRMSNKKKIRVNQQLQEQGAKQMTDNTAYVYPAVIEKLRNTKLSENLTPETLADIAYSVVHGSSKVLPGKYENTVKLVKPKVNKGYTNTGIIGEFDNAGSLKSVFPDNPRRKKKLLGGDGK